MTTRNSQRDNTIEARLETWRNEVYVFFKDTDKAVHETLDEIRQRPTRQEIESMLATKVNAEVYNAEMQSIREDIKDIRDKPQKLQGWLGLIVAGGGCLITIVSVILSTLIAVATLILQGWHP